MPVQCVVIITDDNDDDDDDGYYFGRGILQLGLYNRSKGGEQCLLACSHHIRRMTPHQPVSDATALTS